MVNLVKLRRKGQIWEFENEAALEDFLWHNLMDLLGVTPLARQFSASGQICDILALSKTNALVIVELKNEDDRYIVNQITRYHDALLEKRPFPEQIDYSQPVCLMAIAPNFHRDNFTDRKYSRLSITFLQFNLVEAQPYPLFQLKDVDNHHTRQLEIPLQPEAPKDDLPNPPRALLNLLSNSPEAERQGVFKTRERLLTFHPRMKEFSMGSSIGYGAGKSNLCAEIRFDKERTAIVLFLWLTHIGSEGSSKKIVVRMKLWTDWMTVSDIGHVPKGLGKKLSFDEWQAGQIRPLKKLLPQSLVRHGLSEDMWDANERFFTDPDYRKRFTERYWYLDPNYRSGLAMRIEQYRKLIVLAEEPSWSNALDYLLDRAFETWAKRL